MLSYAHIIREDPVRRGLLYLGTENGLYVSFDAGERWQSLQLNLPHAPVYGMVIQEQFNDLVLSTYGRGIWILDDLSPLQKLSAEVAATPAQLFTPRAAYRFRDVPGNYSGSDDLTAGTNPKYGAAINYWLKAAPQSAPAITIADAQGKTVRTLQGTRFAGLNRVYWDLRNEASKSPRMRTKPQFDDAFSLSADGTRDAPGFGAISVLLPPGRYTAHLVADGQSFAQPLEVRKDPGSAVSDEELRANVQLQLTMQGELSASADMLNTMETVRAQIGTLNAQVANDRSSADIRAGADSLEQKFMSLEAKLQDLRMTGRGQDAVRWPVRLGGQLSYVAANVASSDFAPTAQQKEVQLALERQLRDDRAALALLIERDLKSFNDRLRAKNLKTIDVTLPAVVF